LLKSEEAQTGVELRLKGKSPRELFGGFELLRSPKRLRITAHLTSEVPTEESELAETTLVGNFDNWLIGFGQVVTRGL
jgi:hypothetical protein